MYRKSLLMFLLFVFVQGQLNGDFWWLNSKLNNLKNVIPTPPKIEVSDFQNDDSSRIIFRDDDLFTNKLKPIKDRTSKLMPNNNLEGNKVVWPKEEHMKSHDVEVFTTQNVKENLLPTVTKPNLIKNKYDDMLIFSYPKNEKLVTINVDNESTNPVHVSTQNTIKATESSSTEISLSTYKLPTMSTIITKHGESQNICTYTGRNKCLQLNGFVYEYARRIPPTSGDEPLVCCILPIESFLNESNISQTIQFPQSSNRYRRSNTETNIALRQRDFLLKHKYPPRLQNAKPVSTPLTKIVTPPEDDYVDPYWNIKNTEVQTNPNVGSTKYGDYSEDSVEYADEIPKPGLVGLYSDHVPSHSRWPINNGNKGFSYGGPGGDYIEEEDDEDDYDTFGYSTIDPRQGTKKQKVKPAKLTTTSDELAYDAERHTINFQSNPDFHVFQGFKLLNLFRNTSRVYTKKTPSEDQDTDVLVGSPENSEEKGGFFDEEQFFEGCGRVAIKKANDRGNQIGQAANGSHPWLALVVLTKRKHNILCYATLIHPRAAISVADCTEGTADGDVTVISGLWDLKDKSRSKSRVATVNIHPKYKPGEVENNLALLYWMQPLKLGINVEPACLGQPQVGDECKFFGWGGLDQGIQQPRARWQRATIRHCSHRASTLNKRINSSEEAFCVSAQRGIVTGLGGPLICEKAGHSSIVGVVVSRNNGYVLSPVRDWTMKMDSLVSGD